MTSETERTNQAMDLMGWLLQNRAFLYTAENRYAGETAAETRRERAMEKLR